jgi:hypothetical protein
MKFSDKTVIHKNKILMYATGRWTYGLVINTCYYEHRDFLGSAVIVLVIQSIIME